MLTMWFSFVFIAFDKFPSTHKPNFVAITSTCSTTESEALGGACATACDNELMNVLRGCNFEDLSNVQSVLRDVCGRVFLPHPTRTPLKKPKKPADNMQYFVRALVESNFGVDAKTRSMFGCYVMQLYEYFERHRSSNKKQGIKEMTYETLEVLREIDRRRRRKDRDLKK